ncbi:MAG: hypothetical protein K2H34_03605 [Lachnospiraceae bacterium]|nr:hypothetical protein [Lachnospiraceae bacterium]
MTKQEIINELYDTCKNMTEEEFIRLEKEADSQEERSFYIAVSNFFLQLQQKEVIKQEKY